MADFIDQLSDTELLQLAGVLGLDANSFLAPDTSTSGEQNPEIMNVSPEIADAVSRVYGAQRDLGNQDLHRTAVEAAGQRGLNFTDTPIADPYFRGKALMESQLRGNEASTLLGLQQNYTGQRQNFLSGLYNFQQQLSQNAFNNRLQMAQQAGQTGLGLGNQRAASGTTTQSNSGLNSGGLGLLGSGLGALGNPAVQQGISGLGNAFSSLFGLGGGGGVLTDSTDWSGYGF